MSDVVAGIRCWLTDAHVVWLCVSARVESFVCVWVSVLYVSVIESARD